MGYLIGAACILAGIGLWGLAIFALVSWWVFCFGSVVIGLLLLFFAPHLLLFPLVINVPGTGLISLGVRVIEAHQQKARTAALIRTAEAAIQFPDPIDLDELAKQVRWRDATGSLDTEHLRPK